VHAFKLIGMLLDAHINLKTIDIVPLLYSPKMVRLPLPSSSLAAAHLQLTELCTRFCRSYWTMSRRQRRYWPQASLALVPASSRLADLRRARTAFSPATHCVYAIAVQEYTRSANSVHTIHPQCDYCDDPARLSLLQHSMLCCTCCPRAAVDLRVYAPRAQNMTEEQDTEAEKPKPHSCSAKSTVPPSSGKAFLLIHSSLQHILEAVQERSRVYPA